MLKMVDVYLHLLNSPVYVEWLLNASAQRKLETYQLRASNKDESYDESDLPLLISAMDIILKDKPTLTAIRLMVNNAAALIKDINTLYPQITDITVIRLYEAVDKDSTLGPLKGISTLTIIDGRGQRLKFVNFANDVIRKAAQLRHLTINSDWLADAMLNFEENYTLIDCGRIPIKISSRNKRLLATMIKAALTLIMIRKHHHSLLNYCPKEIVLVIAKQVFAVRFDKAVLKELSLKI